MSDEFCPRQIIFTLPGNPGVQITATERDGKIDFIVDVIDTTHSTGDLRALFFHLTEDKLPGLTFTGGDGYLTGSKVSANNVIDMGGGANLSGAVKTKFDVGLEWGTPGGGKDDINFAVHFTMDNAAHNLTLDDIAGQLFGARLDSIGGPGGPRNGATKLVGLAPAAPDARADNLSIFEDGAAGLNSPSKTPTGVTLDLLANDTDADGQLLKITLIHEGPSHGTVTIAPDGRSVIYTPNADYSGTDSFLYCISDGNGGQDSALATVTVVAVADDPVITFTARQGATIDETIITVTARQNDADGSEYIDSINWAIEGGVPAGVTITPGSINPTTTPNMIVQEYVVTTAGGQDWNFGIDFTARSVEQSNGDIEDASRTQSITIERNTTTDTLTYQVTNQSIWSAGPQATFAYAEKLGFDWGVDSAYWLNDPVFNEYLGTGWDIDVDIFAGFRVDIALQGGAINANVPVDLSVSTTFNRTTGTLLIDSSAALGQGTSFSTTGPGGHINIDSLFSMTGNIFAEILTIDVFNATIATDFAHRLFDFDSTNPKQYYDVFSEVIDAAFEWPHLNVTGTSSGSGSSNNFFEAILDVDAFYTSSYTNFFDEDPNDPNNEELFDLDITGGLNFIQQFVIGLAGQTVNLVLEDKTVVAMTLGQTLRIDNALSHDSNGDGKLDFSFDFTPLLQLTNTTSLGGNLSAQLTTMRNVTLPDGLGFLKIDNHYPIVSADFEIYSDTFDLAVTASQPFNFFV